MPGIHSRTHARKAADARTKAPKPKPKPLGSKAKAKLRKEAKYKTRKHIPVKVARKASTRGGALRLPEDHVVRPMPARKPKPAEGREGRKDLESQGQDPVIDLTMPASGEGGTGGNSAAEAGPSMDPQSLPVRHTPSTPLYRTKLERQALAYDLRAAGWNYRQIGEHLAVSVKTAYFDVQEGTQYIREHTKVLAEDYQAMELTRLDKLTAAFWPAAESGDTFAGQLVLKTIERRCKLLGLDAPEEININVRRPMREASLEDIRAMLERLGDTARPMLQKLMPGPEDVAAEAAIDVTPMSPIESPDEEPAP